MQKLRTKNRYSAANDVLKRRIVANASRDALNRKIPVRGLLDGADMHGRMLQQGAPLPAWANYEMPLSVSPLSAYPPQLRIPTVLHVMLYK